MQRQSKKWMYLRSETECVIYFTNAKGPASKKAKASVD